MKFFLSFFFLLLSNLCVCSQTQQGYVKTLGRPDKKGEPLSAVSVRVKGEHNPVLSKDNGKFEMILTGKKNGDAYTLQEVQKKGYELNDIGVIGCQYAYSDKVPLTIVMVSSAQLQSDKQRIENNAYKVAEKNYKAKLDLLERKKEENAISEEQYRKELLDLQDKFEKYQLLIDGLAEHYAHVDYDGLNDKEREINICIENGDLERADSLIKTMFDPIDVLKRNKEALAQLNQQISEANTIIDKANEDMAAVLKQQEKDANYLYQLYTIALSRFDNDKAGQYIETRAELDTTNIRWQVDAASYHRMFSAKYQLAERFLQRGLAESYRQYKGWNMISAYILNDLARTYEDMGKMKNANDCYNDAFSLFSHFKDSVSNEIAMLYNNHGLFLMKNGVYDIALQSLEKAREIKIQLYGEDHVQLANVYNNIGMANHYLQNHNEALNYYQKALPLYLKQYGEKNENVANCYNNIGITSFAIDDTVDARINLGKALDIRMVLYGIHSLPVAESYNNTGCLYQRRGDNATALNYHKQALSIREDMLGQWHTDVAQSLVHIGEVYDATMSFECVGYYKRALQIYLQSSLAKNSSIIQPVATKYYNAYCAGASKGLTTSSCNEFKELMSGYVILLTVMDGDTPASRLGMKGQYVLLEFDKWKTGADCSVFQVNNSLRGKPKDILVYDDSGINSYHFESNLGAKMELWYLGKEEKEKVVEFYNQWKNEHSR
jgi:tetratricopeptide (TPR) repeat protein